MRRGYRVERSLAHAANWLSTELGDSVQIASCSDSVPMCMNGYGIVRASPRTVDACATLSVAKMHI